MKGDINGIQIQPPQWDDIRVSLDRAQRTGGATKPDWGTIIAGQPFEGWLVDDTADNEYLHFKFELPHGCYLPSAWSWHVHFTPTAAGAGTCIWMIDYSIVDINGAFPGSQTITFTANVALNSNGKHLIVAATAGAPASAAAAGVTGVSAVCLCRLWRQGSVDTLVGDACPTDVGVHIEWDRPGSRQMYVK